MFVIVLFGFETSSRRNNCQVPTMALYVAKLSGKADVNQEIRDKRKESSE